MWWNRSKRQILILVLLVRPTGFFGGGDAKANRV